jgi:uncharacterized membrane protein (TIGR02234 family)
VSTSVVSRLRPGSPGQALALTVLLGAAGAGIAFLGTKQGWAQVTTSPPKPLPASRMSVTGAAMIPYADALVVAGLACLAAVLATKRTWRRVSGLVLAGLGAGLGAAAFTVSGAAAVAAAAASVGPASNPGAGSVTQGTSASPPVPDVVGATPHVAMMAAGWQALVVAGALAMIAAGAVALCRPTRLAEMGGKYEAPARSARTPRRDGRTRLGAAAGASPEPSAAGDARRPGDAQGPGDALLAGAALPADSASLWEALSRGDDPTAGGRTTTAGA